MDRQFEIFEWEAQQETQWDKFVLDNKRGSIHQTSSWKNFQESIPGREKVLGFGVKEDGKIIATVFCVRMFMGVKTPFGKPLYWFYSSRGPVYQDAQAAEYLIREISQKLKKESGIFWRIDPYSTQAEIDQIAKSGISPTQTYQPTDSLVLDITSSEEDILAQMKRQGRRGIKAAVKNQVQVNTYSGAEAPATATKAFFDLNHETTSRNNFSGHDQKYYENFLKKLSPHAFLCTASVDGEVLAASILTVHGSKAIYYFGASSSKKEHRDIRAPYLLQWKMIQKSKQEGATSYDFTGITPEDEPEHAYKGITEFKMKFGGDRHTYSPGKEIVFNRFWYSLYRLIKKLK